MRYKSQTIFNSKKMTSPRVYLKLFFNPIRVLANNQYKPFMTQCEKNIMQGRDPFFLDSAKAKLITNRNLAERDRMISVLGKSDDPSRNFWLPYQNYSVYQCVWPGFTTPSGSLPKSRAPAPGNREKALELQPAHRFTPLFKCKLSQQRALETHII